jgi:4-aminobutyrate aminotransferase-like enzyme
MATGEDVRSRLARHVLTDGLHLTLDLGRSRRSWIVDAQTSERYLDLYAFYASAPLGISPPGIADDREFLTVLAEAAVNKPTNPDIYTCHYADFVETFARVLGDPAWPNAAHVPEGCRFHPRCPLYRELGEPTRCLTDDRALADRANGHAVACHFAKGQG